MDFFSEISREIVRRNVRNKDELQTLKTELARKYSFDHIPKDTEILSSGNFPEEIKQMLRIKSTRTISGVAVVAAMTSPERCPHGKCIYCPGGVESNSPQAYTGYEPAALRGRSNGYISYNEVFSRLKQLETIGHDTSKVDLIVMGGTFTSRTEEYQRNFVKGCLDAMNMNVSDSLDSSILENEDSNRKCIGLTVETKPDWFMERDIDLALSYGTTKVELGVQVLSEKVLRLNNRGHGMHEIIRSTALARDSGMKIVYHVMPGMYGTGEEDDYSSIDRMLDDPSFRPDMLKIYPTLVVKGTALYKYWKEGKYVPPDTDRMVDFLTYVLKRSPPWIRIQRVQRDIPVKFISAGVKRSDIRNMAESKLRGGGVKSPEIRYREVGRYVVPEDEVKLTRTDYDASGGKEIFLSYESTSAIVGFVRLRILSPEAHRQELSDSTIIREIKVFGNVVPVGKKSENDWQHRGFGKNLLNEAERISTEEYGSRRIAVISGIGVRNYFRSVGYERSGPYMMKSLSSAQDPV